MDTKDIYEWTFLKIRFIKKFQEKIENVKIFNETIEIFGRKYFRIYFTISLNVPLIIEFPSDWTDYKMTEIDKYNNTIHSINSELNDYWSYYALHTNEIKVETDYKWIVALFEDQFLKELLMNKTFNYEIEKYISESHLERENRWELERQKQEEDNKIFFETYKPIATIGDVAIIRKYGGEKLIEIDNNRNSMYNPYSGFELKNDFTKGKRKCEFISEDDILIVMTKKQLSNVIRDHPLILKKDQLINFLKVGSNKKNKFDLKYVQKRIQ